MMNRNRSSGWKHGKLSGHDNEKNVYDLVNNNQSFKEILASRINIGVENLIDTSIGGINEKNIPSIFSNKLTKSKTDLKIQSKKKAFNFSLKKSTGGQVYLITIDRFIAGMKYHFQTKLTAKEEEAMNLFFGGGGDKQKINNIIDSSKTSCVDSKIKRYEKRKNRLTMVTMEAFNEDLPIILLNFFEANISEIFLFCFSRGLAKNKKDWAGYIWYINTIGEDPEFGLLDKIYKINHLPPKMQVPGSISYGPMNGGTTIQLPFGFVQWHQGQMQFHHSLKKISCL